MTVVRALQPPDGTTMDGAAVVAALATEFDVVLGSPRVVRRTLLDTFDRRLERASMRLEHVTAAGDDRLELAGSDDVTVLVAPGPAPAWPAMADALPAGPLRDEVARVTDIRALLVVEQGRRRIRRAELRNADRKLVLRLELDEPVGADADAPARVVLRPLRGYEPAARTATKVLRSAHLRPVDDTDGAPRPPAPVPDLVVDRDDPAVRLLAVELGSFLDAMQANLPGLLDDVDTEFLHDFRVAVRRTRSTLKLGRAALPDTVRAEWEPQFKWLGDLTTPVRDLDVYELELATMGGWLVAADAADLQAFGEHLRRRRRQERRALVRGLRGARYTRLVEGWRDQVASLPDDVTGKAGNAAVLTAGELADRNLSRAYRTVLATGSAVTESSPAEDLHALRKKCKELRYALEVFAPVLDPADRKKAVSDLKGLQDVLGRFQDSEVQRQTLRRFAEEMMADGAPAETLLAMGELVGHLDAEQQRARAEFGSAFATFTRPAGDRRLRRLGGRGPRKGRP